MAITARSICISAIMTALALLLSLPVLASDPLDGTEIVLTDLAGGQLLGYGRFEQSKLVLDLSTVIDTADKSAAYLVLIVRPDGSFETFQGVLEADRLLVIREDGVRRDLAEVVGGTAAELSIRWVNGDKLNDEETSDGGRTEGEIEDSSSVPSDPAEPGDPSPGEAPEGAEEGSGSSTEDEIPEATEPPEKETPNGADDGSAGGEDEPPEGGEDGG